MVAAQGGVESSKLEDAISLGLIYLGEKLGSER